MSLRRSALVSTPTPWPGNHVLKSAAGAYYFNRHVGKWALGLAGTAPFYTPSDAVPSTPVLATPDEGETALSLVLANGGAKAHANPARSDSRVVDVGSQFACSEVSAKLAEDSTTRTEPTL